MGMYEQNEECLLAEELEKEFGFDSRKYRKDIETIFRDIFPREVNGFNFSWYVDISIMNKYAISMSLRIKINNRPNPIYGKAYWCKLYGFSDFISIDDASDNAYVKSVLYKNYEESAVETLKKIIKDTNSMVE